MCRRCNLKCVRRDSCGNGSDAQNIVNKTPRCWDYTWRYQHIILRPIPVCGTVDLKSCFCICQLKMYTADQRRIWTWVWRHTEKYKKFLDCSHQLHRLQFIPEKINHNYMKYTKNEIERFLLRSQNKQTTSNCNRRLAHFDFAHL